MFYEHVCAGRLAPRVFVNSCQRPSDENITDIVVMCLYQIRSKDIHCHLMVSDLNIVLVHVCVQR